MNNTYKLLLNLIILSGIYYGKINITLRFGTYDLSNIINFIIYAILFFNLIRSMLKIITEDKDKKTN